MHARGLAADMSAQGLHLPAAYGRRGRASSCRNHGTPPCSWPPRAAPRAARSGNFCASFAAAFYGSSGPSCSSSLSPASSVSLEGGSCTSFVFSPASCAQCLSSLKSLASNSIVLAGDGDRSA
eukprot:3336369-Pleurochrysis_carterae.AAC.1